MAEPSLTVLRRPSFFRRRGFLFSFTPTAFLAIAGLVSLLVAGHTTLPFEPVITLEGKIASKAEFFEDEQVQQMLMRHHIRVHLTQTGSREIAVHDVDQYDFVMPSGQPAADLIVKARPNAVRVYRPFITPLVLATYREYADTLVDAGIAAPQGNAGTLYYTLNTERFIDAMQRQVTWRDLLIDRHGIANGNKILAQSPDVCTSNSAGTYLGVIAFIQNNHSVPQTEAEADSLAASIKPILTGQGLPGADLFAPYVTPEGRGSAPIVVVYEHQYLAYQVQYRARSGRPDNDRVLLYPEARFETQPQFLALNPRADQLGELITRDPDLRRRAMELGFRVLDESGATASGQLGQFLQQQGVQPPSFAGNDTKTYLPGLDLLERMIKSVGGCS
ncbi:hypothetical protein [Amycolatopsis pithecellobii]|uniref:Extracellular solute-binding protein n=1 Tax=Amycolatopsis pithecellobii TaxID=664692 RepID=A0A6N7ZCK1_9PSEU|nr:hypothetical protein [Amycolatopsis pithecellobii]MTD59347.1 hypothetical protein [Amycolatopsis pithecellobii]